jgi:hypothetical protein
MASDDRKQHDTLAEQSLNTSVVHPQNGRDAPGDPAQGNRTLAGNQQREGQEKASDQSPKRTD